MKPVRFLFAIMIAVIFSSCSEYGQVVYTKPISDGINKQEDYYVFEDDKIKVVYDFWAPRGMMHFTLYNKTNKPLYVDWNKSSFVNQKNKVRYYEGREYTTSITTSADAKVTKVGTIYGAPAAATKGKGVSYSSGTTVREERITFIPPQSSITKTFNNLVANIYYKVTDYNSTEKEIHGISVHEITLGDNVEFRNFLTYSTTEQFENEFYIDNGFRITKIESLKAKFLFELYKPTRFYIDDLKELS